MVMTQWGFPLDTNLTKCECSFQREKKKTHTKENMQVEIKNSK